MRSLLAIALIVALVLILVTHASPVLLLIGFIAALALIFWG